MESNCETVTLTPSKSKLSNQSKLTENTNPNVVSPNPKKTEKSETKKSICSTSPKQKIRERKFVVVAKKKKNSKVENDVNNNNKNNNNNDKTLISAYESLRASQEDFFRVINFSNKNDDQVEGSNPNVAVSNADDDEKEVGVEVSGEKRKSIPEPGSGRVKDLVKAFENKLTLPKTDDEKEEEDEVKRDSSWEMSSVSFCASDLLLTAENLGLGSRVSSSLDGSNGRITSIGGGRQIRRNNSELASSLGGGKWKRRTVRSTSLQPFKLRTEQRGRSKQEEFMKKVQEMMIEQEKQRIPVAQGLPYTTDEPECLVKPPVKESTRPVDLVLHSDVRAVERAEFDQQVQEKLSFIEQYKLERERQQKLLEEEELRRLRKELVPKAQPMPYFDRPFIPRRSERQPTIPKEPRFHNPQHKKFRCCMSWSDMSACQHH
uniref:reticulocyte-binding protein 2 homolog a n=1 Tax=Erigeron canadensis TaxID=72917 RepID=UPI001CB8DC69|nr:reticulocyte-binding protein 2 homolog a [Erigeron canadensis]